MHLKGMLHRDLKPENLLLMDEKDLSIKVTDFGMATYYDSIDRDLVLGTPQYMSPEMVWSDKPYHQGTDIWSAGILTYELLTGFRPFDHPDEVEQNVKIASEQV
jgi:serine/threonine protein kinase